MSCKGCAYAVYLSGVWCCDYLQIAGHRRPCPPGEDCTARKEADLTKKGSAFMKRRGWDTERARTLYDEKLSDAEIAGKVGLQRRRWLTGGGTWGFRQTRSAVLLPYRRTPSPMRRLRLFLLPGLWHFQP